MEEDNTAQRQVNPDRLRRLMLVPMGWLVLVLVVPNFILGALGIKAPWFSYPTEAVCILLWAGFLAYLLIQVRKEHGLVALVLTGLGLLLLSESIRVARNTRLLEYLPLHNANALSRPVENAFNGLGFAVIACAFIYAIIDMLASRRQLMEEQARLSQEIANRQQVENTLRKSEAMLQGIGTSALDAVILMDNAGRVYYWNPAAERLLGYKAEEIIGKPAHEILAPARYRKAYTKGLQNWHATGEGPVVGKTMDLKAVRKDGAEIDIALSVSSVQIGGQWFAVGILRDVTEHKEADDALKQSEARYRSLVDNSGDIVWRMDLQGRFTFVSSAAKALAGYDPEELLGQSIRVVMDEESGTRALQALAQRRSLEYFGTESSYFEVVSRRKDGSSFPSEVVSTPIFDHEGNLIEIQGVTRDATERVNSDRLIAEQQAKMIQTSRLAALGTMAGGIAHEINNPLATISVATELLETLLHEEYPDRDRVKKVSETIAHHISRISSIIQGLKMLSRDDTQDPFALTPLQSLINNTLELCQTRFAAHGIALTVPDISPARVIECKPTQYSQVLVNLLNNAFDAVEHLPEKWVRLEVFDEEDTIALAVTDSGPGVPPEIRDKVLDPFFTTKEPGKGVGLGLSVSSRLLEAQHGELVIDTDCPNTRFIVRLPKRQPESAYNHPQAEVETPIV
ncbi:MAG TPA: PAS domain S-box protein [Candidatus Hydrogenedentes bacterium]|nr:PAS domain S-box protein [Candidatus Hydrogenedentota bacterium]